MTTPGFLRPHLLALAGALVLGLALGGNAAAATPPTDAAPSRPPPPGHYMATMCVQSLVDESKPANCGPAEFWMRRGQRAQLRVSDLKYLLTLHSSQVDVVLWHGAVMIDEFTAFYDWRSSTLHFTDRDQRLRYQIEVGTGTSTPPR